MKRARIAPLLVLLATATPSQAAGPLWLMSAREWRASAPAVRLELVRDYMRAFCARPTMSASTVVRCVDSRSKPLPGKTALFDVASQCVLEAG